MGISPSSVVWGSNDQPVPSGEFSITINVTNVVELFSWQIKLYYNPAVIDTTPNDVYMPTDHVFAGKPTMPMPVVIDSDANGKFVLWSGCLQGGYSFTGSGKLCIINFTAVTPGITELKFSRPLGGEDQNDLMNGDTYLWKEYTGVPEEFVIKFTVTEGTVTVRGQTVIKEPSSISLSASKTDLYVKQAVTLRGSIDPVKPNVDVNIYYKVVGAPSFSGLTQVTTDDQGNYSYVWRPDEVFVYELYAEWGGDATHNGNKSASVFITVRKPPSYILFQDSHPVVGNSTHNPPTSPGNITLKVSFADNMTSWQFKLFYLPRIVEILNFTFPQNHVFNGKDFSNLTLNVPDYNATHGYILCNATLSPGETPFSGNGTLIIVFFRGLLAETLPLTEKQPYMYSECPLIFDEDETRLTNSTGSTIHVSTPDDGLITVLGKMKVRSTLFIILNPGRIVLGDFVKISVKIDFKDQIKRPNCTILILYKLKGDVYNNLTTVTVDAGVEFVTTWQPQNATEYKFMAKYFGTNETAPSTSPEASLTVTSIGAQVQSEIDLLPFASIAVIAYVVIVSFVVVKRTKEE